MTQPPSAQRAKKASIILHSHLPSNRLALEDSRLTPWRKVQAKTTSSNETLFKYKFNVAACICYYSLQFYSFFLLLKDFHAFANLHFHVHSANLVYFVEITCWTIWLDPPNAWRSLRYAGYISFPACYTGSDICAGWGLGMRLVRSAYFDHVITFKALWCFERGSEVKICNGIMFDFYLGLPHVINYPAFCHI